MRLIDADSLVEEIESMSVAIAGRDIFPQEAKDCVLAHIHDAPTIDAATVVRCGECIFAEPFPCETNPLLCRVGQARRCSGNDYCSRGKRKEADR